MKQADGIKKLESAKIIPLRGSPKRFIAISGGKGGVGKSTIAANLAVHFAAMGRRTAIVDTDFGMADLNLLYGVAPARSMHDVLQGALPMDVMTECHGVHLLPGLNGAYALANSKSDEFTKIADAIQTVRESFETVVLDTPAGIDARNVNITAAAEEVAIVVTPEPVALADAYGCLKALSRFGRVERAFVIPNAVHSAAEAESVIRQLSLLVNTFLNLELVTLPYVPFDPEFSKAASQGVPLVVENPDAPAARALRRIARAFDNHSFFRSPRPVEEAI